MPAKTMGQHGLLYEQAAAFSQALETSQVAAADQMLAAWTDSYWGIRKEMDAFLEKVAQAKAAGITPSPAWAFQQQRLKNLLDTTKTQIARYAADASLVTEKAQWAAIQASLKHAQSLGKTAVTQALPGLEASLANVNPKVLEAGVGFLADGSVLRNHLALTLPGQAAAKVQEALIHGLATGKSQDWMLRKATEALGLSHSRATTILRTESLRAYRHASRAQYLANQDLLDGWVWNAHLDSRTCVACALMDGTLHPLDATLDGHPRCRCAMVPRTKSWDDLGVKGMEDTRPPIRSGKEWLESQTPAVQRAMMGRAKFDAWVEGSIHLDDMVARTYSPQWGTMRTERSLKAILEDRHPNYFDAPATPPTVVKPPPQADPAKALRLAKENDLAFLQEWAETPGNSPSVLANVKAAINLKVARQGRIGPSLPEPDMAKVQAALDKLENAVLTKGYPSKGYSQSQAIYKAQANGTPGTQVGVVKSLTLEQKVTAQRILQEHNAALPQIIRKAEKKKALELAHDEALAINAQKAAQKAVDDALEAQEKALGGLDASAGNAEAWQTGMDLKYLDLQDSVKSAMLDQDLLAAQKAGALQKNLKAHQQAYDDAVETIHANGWGDTIWSQEGGSGVLHVGNDGWVNVSNADLNLSLDLPPHVGLPMVQGTSGAPAKWVQVLTPDDAEVAKWLDTMTNNDGLITQKGYDMVKGWPDSPSANLTAQQAADLQEALDQAWHTGKWAPEPEYVAKIKGFLDDGTMTPQQIRDLLDDADAKPLSKANAAKAISDWNHEQIAKAAIPVPKPAIQVSKIKWEKANDAQVQKWIDQVESGHLTVDDLYVKFQASKNSGPKANYAKAILHLEGKADTIPAPGVVPDVDLPTTTPTPAPTAGPAWPTKPPWEPSALKDTGQVLGTHGARVYEAPDGTRWLFKPPKDPKDGFLATLDEAASRFQARVGLRAPDTYTVTLGGRRGSIQRMFPAKDGFPNGFDPTHLTKPDLDLVQREHALDWLLSNHDGHRDQFLRLEDGTMVGIDKGQAFRWFGQDSLDWDFHPNQAYGAPPPVYNRLWSDFANGKDVDLDPPGQGALWDQIRTIQAVPDDEFREMFRGYAEQAAARGLLAKRQQFPGLHPSSALENDVEAFLDALVARKHDLEKDFTALWEKAVKARQKAIPGWKPKAASTSGKPGLQKWVGKPKPDAPKPPEAPDAAVAKDFDGWLDAARERYAAFAPGKTLDASNNWARFQKVVNDLDANAAKELLDRHYLRQVDYDEALDLIAKAKAKKAALEADYKKALAAHDKTVQAYKKDVKDWAEANGITDLTQGMDDAVIRHLSDEDGVKWATKHFSEDRYTATQRKWLKSYTGSSYSSWNDHLCATKGKPTQYESTYKALDKAMEAQPIPEDVILHRGTVESAFEIDGKKMTSGDDLARLIGSTQTDWGYMSTSVGNSAAFSSQSVQLKIRAPKGTPGAYVQMFSNYHHERELILARGTHMYVHNAYKENGRWFLEVEVVPDDFDAAQATAKPSAKPWKG